ncbi:MAG: leucine-rich repeat protein [Bacteroidales bacterium]|nr:leucine-rich repeat protein [Bacteroidales bacterium]
MDIKIIKPHKIPRGGAFCKFVFTFLLFLLAAPPLTVMAQTEITFKGLTYEINTQTKTAMVTGVVSDDATEYIVPGMFEYGDAVYTVTAIDNGAFSNCEKATKITLPVTIESIGGSAFLTCKSLTSLHISGLITAIGDNTFQGCTSLTEIVIPATVTSIGKNAFKDTQLETIVCNGINPPSLKNNTFADLTLSDIQLIVPENQTDYSSASTWKKLDIQTVPRIDIAALRSAIDLLIPDTKTYDGTNSVQWSCPDYDHDGIADSIIAPLANIPTDKDVKVKIISVEYDYTRNKIVTKFTLIGDDVTEYVLTENVFEYDAELAPAQLTLVDCEPQDKDYDGNNKVLSVTGCKLKGVVLGDDVEISEVDATFVNAAPGVNKEVTFNSITLAGVDHDKYSDDIQFPTGKTATIYPYTIKFPEDPYDPTDPQSTHNEQSVYAEDKVYDGTTTATIHFPSSINGVGGDVLSNFTCTADFLESNVGEHAVTISNISFTCSNPDHTDFYTFENMNLQAAITPKEISVTSIDAKNKVYDGSDLAEYENIVLSESELEGVSLVVGSAKFADKNVDEDKKVTFGDFSLEGTNASNYKITTTSLTSRATITKKDVHLSGFEFKDKVFDGSSTASFMGTITSSDFISTDNISVSQDAANFENANVGEDKEITFTNLRLVGQDKDNYNLITPTDLKANITPAIIEVTGLSAENKVYDGNTTVTITGTPVYTCTNSALTIPGKISFTAAFVDKNAGTGKSINFEFVTNSDNFSARLKTQLTANITKKEVKIDAVKSADKIYNGTTEAAVNIENAKIVDSDGNVFAITGDDLSISTSTVSANFDTKNVGTDKDVTFSGFALEGDDVGNYTLMAQPTSVKNAITQKTITLTWQDQSEFPYNGEEQIRRATISGVEANDDCSLTFAEPKINVGSNYVSTASLNGEDKDNYKLPDDNTTAVFSITAVAPTFTPPARVIVTYNGSAQPLLTVGEVTGGEFQYSLTENGIFTSEIPSKKDADEYTIYYKVKGDANHNDSQVGSITSTINKKSVTITGVKSADRTYNGNTNATADISEAIIDGKVSLDDLNITAGTASFSDKNVGTGKAVTFSGFTLTGTDANNYELSAQPASVNNSITKLTVTLSGLKSNDKDYDGNTTADIVTTDISFPEMISGDNLSITGGTANFADANADANKDVTISGYTLSGTDADNYSLSTESTSVTVKNEIRPKEVTIEWGTTTFEYDGMEKIPTATVTNLVLGTSCLVTVEGAQINAGTYSDDKAAKAVSLSNPNYKLPTIQPTIDFTINRATPTIADEDLPSTPANGTIGTDNVIEMPYNGLEQNLATGGQNNPTGTKFQYKVGSDGTYADAIPTRKDVGEYTVYYRIVGTDGNHNDVQNDANQNFKVRITRVPLTITAENKTINYGSAAPSYSVSYSGFVNNEAESVLSGILAFDCDYAQYDNAGNYDITPSGLTSNNYTITFIKGTLTVDKITVGITWQDKSEFVYNGENQSPTATLTSVVEGTTCTPTLKEGGVNVGNYTAEVIGLSNTNYLLPSSGNNKAYSITQKEVEIVSVTVSDKTYDGNKTAEVSESTLSGVLTADESNVSLVNATAEFAEKNVGQWGITFTSDFTLTGTKAENYTLKVKRPTDVKANITPKDLTVKANNHTITYGDAPSNNGVTYSGFISGEDESVLSGTLDYDYTYAQYEDYDKENKTITPKGLTSENYNIIYQSGNLTVNQLTATLSWTPNPATWVYDGIEHCPVPSVSNTVNSDVVTVTYEGAQTDAGDYTALATALTGDKAKNYVLSNVKTQAFSITKETPSITTAPSANDLTYNGSAQTLITAGECGNGTLKYRLGETGDFSTTLPKSTNAATYTIYYMIEGNSNYQSTTPTSLTATIKKANLTIAADNKEITYGENAPSFTKMFTTLLGTDTENGLNADISMSCEYVAGNNVGDYLIEISGNTELQNYNVTYTNGKLTVKKKDIAITWDTEKEFTYNGQTHIRRATIAEGSLFGSDNCTLTFATEQTQASDMPYTSTATLNGEKSGNYNITNPTSNFTIKKATPAITISSVQNLVYNGSDQQLLATYNTSGGTLKYKVGESGTYSETLPTGKKAGEYTVYYKVEGNSNYNSVDEEDLTVSIAPKPVTIVGVESENKVYDGNNTASVISTEATISGKVATDNVTISTTNAKAAFANVNVGTWEVAFRGFALEGEDKDNYSLSAQPASKTYQITQRPLTISGISVSDKPYDGNTTATALGGELNNVVSGDESAVTIVAGNANFDNANVGTDKPITFTNYSLSGEKASNYSLSQPQSTTANITAVTITITAENKTIAYGDNAPTYTVTYSNNFKNNENSSVLTTLPTISCDYNTTVADKRKQGTYTITTSGAVAQNYVFEYENGTLTVEKKEVGLTWDETPLEYNASEQHPLATVNSTDLVYGDNCIVSAYEGAQTNAGKNYTVTATALSIDNYKLSTPNPTHDYNIAQKPVTIINLKANNKVYDGNTVATTTGGELSGVVDSDEGAVTIKAGNATFVDKDVAENIVVAFTNYELEGSKAANYVLSVQPANSAANITKKDLTVTANDHTIVYGEEPSNNGVTYSGFVDGEDAAHNLSNTLQFNYKTYHKNDNYGVYENEIVPYNLESQNYEFNYVAGTLTVVQKQVEIQWGNLVSEYDKQTHKPTATVVGDNDCEVTIVVKEGESINAGYYTAEATGLSNQNYALPNYNLKIGFEITPKEASISWGTSEFDFNGKAQKPEATAGALLSGDECTITVGGAQVNAGTYTATAVEVSNRNYKLPSDETVNQTFTIKKVLPEITEPIEYTLTYNGENQVLIMAGSTTAGEMLYSLNGTDYSKSLPTAKNANNYTVYYKVVGNTNFTDVEPRTITPVIEKAPFKVTADDKTITYGDATPTITFSYDGFVEGESTTNITVGSANYLNYTGNAGVYTIGIDKDKFSADNYDLQFKDGTFTVLQKEVEVSWDYTQPYPYDGQEHCPKATVETVSGDVCNVTVSGTQTNAGEYTAKATSIDNDNYKLIMNDKIYQEFEIKPKGVTVQWDGNIFEYDGTAKYPKANVKAEDIVGSDVCEVVVSGANVAVGNYTATAVELSNRNYVIANGKTHDYKITPTLPSPVVAPKPNNSVYNGFEQNLVSAGSTTAGEMLYSLSRDGEFNTALPQAKNADNYTVYYKVRGNSNYSDTEIGEVNVTIEKAPLRVLWGELSFVYNHEEQKPEATVSGLFANEVIDVAVNGGKVNGGNYTATASIESDNYQLEEPTTIEFEILPKKLMIGKVDVQIVKDYDGNNTAEITSELPTNAYEGDNYNLRATAVYNDAEVSTNKVITLSFSLEDNPNYYLDDNEKEYVYSREAIIVGTPTLVLDEDKLYAYPASEIGNDIYAEAFYNGEKLSGRMTYEPKSGTVLRALDEKQEVVARFVPDQNCYKEVSQTFAVMVSNKIETNNIRITVDVTNEYLCSNKVLLEYEVLTGKVERYEITFDDSRFESMEGIADNNSQILINLPENLEAGTYKGKIVFFDMAGNVSYPCDFSFTTKIAAKSLFQLYKDVVFVNGDYVDYQWYKNGNMLDGQTGQYLSEDKDLYGTYYALVTNKNGEKYETCPLEIYPTIKKRNAVLSVYPNPAVSMQDIHIDIEDFDEDKTAEIKIYTNGGILVQHIKNAQPENIVNLRSGNYTGVFTQNGVRLSFKIIVK